MRAVIEKETALIMHEIVLVILYSVVFVKNIRDLRLTVNVQYSCDNNAFLYYTL